MTNAYKHGWMTQEEFERAYRHYMDSHGYHYQDFDIGWEWRYYQRGRSWFAAWLDAEFTRDHRR